MEYMAVNPNKTQTSGSCGTTQAELNITFSGGFINFTFVKVIVAFKVFRTGELELQLPFIQLVLWEKAFNPPLLVFHLYARHDYSCPSQDTRIIEPQVNLGWKRLWRPPGPTPCSEQG